VSAPDLELAKRFELFDRARNRRRFYTLRLARDRQLGLYGKGCGSPDIGWILIVSRGRIGGKPIEREERFLGMDRAIERYGHLCTERRSHGYTEVSC